MLSASAVRRWCWIHKWTSLICTIFLLMLCLTGLPLIFHHELDHLLSDLEEPADLPADAPRASLDRVIESAKAARSGEVTHIIAADADEPEVLYVGMGKTPSSPLQDDTTVVVDSRTAKVLGQEKFGEGGFMDWMYLLHVEMFAGIPGKLFLGAMAALFLVAIVSGLVIYAPFMRERSFGVVRRERGSRLKWLDLHNLLGITVAVWALVVGATGMINTWADLLLKVWQIQELGAMTAPYRDKPPVTELASVDQVVAASRASEPGTDFRFVAFPGNVFSSPHHYVVFMRGDQPLTGRILKPVLVDGKTGVFSDKRDMPWYITSLLVSQPLHFGDYGGMPLKIIWALLDVITIVVLVSGVYLWWKRRKIPVEIDLRSSESKEEPATTPQETRPA